MIKTAFLFAGQGSQKVGMARDLYDKYELVRELFYRASQILNYDLRQVIDADEEKLNQTRYTQPAILVTSVAIYRLLNSQGFYPNMVAGFSLGEYSAYVASGSLSFEDAVRLIAKRSSYMEEAVPSGSGKMVAIMNADILRVEEILKKLGGKQSVSIANYNTPQQIVIGGLVDAVDKAVVLIKDAGFRHLVTLNVSGPFHTPLLKPASDRLAVDLEDVSFSNFVIPLVGNTEAQIVKKKDIKSLLARQVMEPVRFYESVETMQRNGINRFIEIGPGQVLSSFVKKINRLLSVSNVEDIRSLEQLKLVKENHGNQE